MCLCFSCVSYIYNTKREICQLFGNILLCLVHSSSAATTQSDTISSDIVGLPAGLCEIHSRWTTYVVDHYSGLVLCVA